MTASLDSRDRLKRAAPVLISIILISIVGVSLGGLFIRPAAHPLPVVPVSSRKISIVAVERSPEQVRKLSEFHSRRTQLAPVFVLESSLPEHTNIARNFAGEVRGEFASADQDGVLALFLYFPGDPDLTLTVSGRSRFPVRLKGENSLERSGDQILVTGPGLQWGLNVLFLPRGMTPGSIRRCAPVPEIRSGSESRDCSPRSAARLGNTTSLDAVAKSIEDIRSKISGHLHIDGMQIQGQDDGPEAGLSMIGTPLKELIGITKTLRAPVGESDPHAIAILGHLLFLSGFPCLGRVTGEYACLLSPDDPDVWAQLARGWSVRDSFLDLDPERQKASQEILSISQGLADKTASGSPARLWD